MGSESVVLPTAQEVQDEQKPTSQKAQNLLKPFAHTSQSRSQLYLTGLRGILVVQSFLWLFMKTFMPGAVSAPRSETTTWQLMLRDIVSVLLWNKSLIYSFFIILSARTVCLPFLENPSGTTLARNLIVRNIRVGFPLTIGATIGIVIFSNIDTGYFASFQSLIPEATASLPVAPASTAAAWGGIYNTMWITRDFGKQALNSFWPSHTIWVPSVIYSQSYTVYILALVLPYTRPAWHWQGLAAFALGSFWFNSWGWYSATGLLLGDISVVPELKSWIKKVFTVNVKDGVVIPTWIPAGGLILIGLVQKYLWVAVAPGELNSELLLHPVYQTSDTTIADVDKSAYARLDDWMIVTGFLLLVELFEPMQKVLSLKPFTYLGNRSLSFFLAQCILFYTVGVWVFVYLVSEQGQSIATATGVVFLLMLSITPLATEIFYRAVDLPSQWFGYWFFEFLRD